MARAILRAMEDPALFAPFFKDAATWQAWRTVLKVLFGTRLTASEVDLFQRTTGRTKAFSGAIREAWLVCGRRSGKSFIAVLIAVYLAAFRDYTASLSPGERGVVLALAVNRDQARVIFRYIEAFFDAVPLLAKLVVGLLRPGAQGRDLAIDRLLALLALGGDPGIDGGAHGSSPSVWWPAAL